MMKEKYYKQVEKMFYNYLDIDNKIENILAKTINSDVNSWIKTNYKKSFEEIEIVNKIDNVEIQKLLKEKYVVEKTLEKYNNDYRQEIIKRRYFKKEKNYIIADSLSLWKMQYNSIVREIINYAVIIATKINLIEI